MRSHFTDHVISSNEFCKNYTAFPSVDVLNSIFKYLDRGFNSENVVLYNSQKIKNDSSVPGIPRKLNPFLSCMLTLVRLRQNFDLRYPCFYIESVKALYQIQKKHTNKLHVFTFEIILCLIKQKTNCKNYPAQSKRYFRFYTSTKTFSFICPHPFCGKHTLK